MYACLIVHIWQEYVCITKHINIYSADGNQAKVTESMKNEVINTEPEFYGEILICLFLFAECFGSKTLIWKKWGTPSRHTVSGTAMPFNDLEDNDSHQISKSIWFELAGCWLFTGRPSPQGLRWRTTSLSFLDFSFSIILFLFIYFFSSHHRLHSAQQVLTMAQKGEGEQMKRRVKNNREPRDTQSCLRVVVTFSSQSSIVRNCNRTSRGRTKSLFCYQNTETWPWVSKASEQNGIVME